MLNYWWVTRPKRKLNSIPEFLAVFAEEILDQEWTGVREHHLLLEEKLELAGLKSKGERRDQGGGGGRTYVTWLTSLGLVFIQESTKKMKLTLAGEAIIAGDSPVEVLKNQVIKYQYPSSFSLGRSICVSDRFKIRPFRFLLRLLDDPDIGHLTEDEIAKIVVVEAENETDKCYRYITERILEYRNHGDACLDADFSRKYKPSRGDVNPLHPYSHLKDLANTLINWLEYTQLAKRIDHQLVILPEKRAEVKKILDVCPPFLDRPGEHEFFQRKYGLDPKHTKDTRNMTDAKRVTDRILSEAKIKQAYIAESLRQPITKISTALVDKIIERTGLDAKLVEETLLKFYPRGSVGSFMAEYYEMAFQGRDQAINFEKATVELFQKVFGYQTKHVGPIGLTPDVLILSDDDGYQAILDNKAYASYSITNDHKNRMIYNYIKGLSLYSASPAPLGFFSYISGGFGSNINSQIAEIKEDAGTSGSAISVLNMIKLVELHDTRKYTHEDLRKMFSLNRQILQSDL